jgi:hypothetical protein
MAGIEAQGIVILSIMVFIGGGLLAWMIWLCSRPINEDWDVYHGDIAKYEWFIDRTGKYKCRRNRRSGKWEWLKSIAIDKGDHCVDGTRWVPMDEPPGDFLILADPVVAQQRMYQEKQDRARQSRRPWEGRQD